jgi:hypothetical protein
VIAVTEDDIRQLRTRLEHIEDPDQLTAIAHSLLDELERVRATAFSSVGSAD